MKEIIVITDSARIADLEFKSLRQSLTDRGLLIKQDAHHWVLYTEEICIRFWNVYSPFPIVSFDTFAYSNCKIGIKRDESIMYQIGKWRMIELLISNMPPNAKEMPYCDIEHMKIWQKLESRSNNDETYQRMAHLQ